MVCRSIRGTVNIRMEARIYKHIYTREINIIRDDEKFVKLI